MLLQISVGRNFVVSHYSRQGVFQIFYVDDYFYSVIAFHDEKAFVLQIVHFCKLFQVFHFFAVYGF